MTHPTYSMHRPGSGEDAATTIRVWKSSRLHRTILDRAFTATLTQRLDRLEAKLKAKSITAFARIDHAAGAASVAVQLRPTELLVFRNPKVGTPLMQSNQTSGLDLS